MSPKLADALRGVRSTADTYHKIAQELSPPNGNIPAGGAHVAAYQKAEALCVFLRGMAAGATPAEALAAGKAAAVEIADKWKCRRGRDYQTYISDIGADALLEDKYRGILRAMEAA